MANFNKNNNKGFVTDGIVINENKSYDIQNIYKWKPANQLTIDFYVEKYD